jgi:hypothetical protein
MCVSGWRILYLSGAAVSDFFRGAVREIRELRSSKR